MLAELKMD